ncbi:MAG: SET domain-containing protein [Pirellulales bacterium]
MKSKRRGPHVCRSRVGLGVFSRRFYADGELIGEILGTVVSEPDYSSPYCYSMGDERSLEPDAPFKFLNHSCQPNAQFDYFDIKSTGGGSERRVFVLASGSIRPGDEITIDYRWPAAMAIRCRCGSANCRGWVIDQEDLADFLAVQAPSLLRDAKRRSETSRVAPAL